MGRDIRYLELFIELTVIASYPLPLASDLDHIAAYRHTREERIVGAL